MYEVEVGADRWTRHRNQLRKRLTPERPSTEVKIPLDVLLDTFNLPAVPTHEETQKVDLRSRRWSLRQR